MQPDENINLIEKSLQSKYIHFAVKRFFDIIASLILLIILSPLFLALIIYIKLDSKGHAIFKQIRVGKDSKLFTIYKFRTMYEGADKDFAKKVSKEELSDFVFQEKNDKRVTRAGKLLRAASLDELPQLFNIIKGDMSLIGPRPEIPDIANYYNEHERIRLMVKPGVSGLAQVNGRGDLSLGETIEYDIKYIKDFSIALDLRIFFETIKVVFKREGAY